MPSAARSVVVGPFATLSFVLPPDLGASAKVDCPKLFSRSCIRGALEIVDVAGLPGVVATAEMFGFSETLELTEGLGWRTIGVVDLVLDGNPDRRVIPPFGNDAVRLGASLDTTGFDSGLGLLPIRDVLECLDVRLELVCP